MKPTYSEEEANAILTRAIEQMPARSEMSRQQLESIAAEVGVTPEALHKAEADLTEERAVKVDRRAFIARRRTGFLRHVAAFVVAMGLMLVAAEEAHDNDAQMVFLIFLIAWGAALALHAWSVIWTRGEGFEARFAKWRISRRAREMAEAELRRLSIR